MQIGEFAKLCETKITILRHYDNEGLLPARYIDPFSGYRYYSKEQVVIFKRISALKNAGFSLLEIKSLLDHDITDEMILELFEKKKADLQQTLRYLNEAKEMMLGDERIMNVIFTQTVNEIIAKCQGNQKNVIPIMEKEIDQFNYQRISAYTYHENEVTCKVLKLNSKEMTLHENIDLPFENDESIIGKWQTVGEYAIMEDFYSNLKINEPNQITENIYFLENGQKYWSYSWTKGKVMIDDDINTYVNDYTTEVYKNERYMFIHLKSYHYRHGGKPTILVLKQLDNISYKIDAIMKKDNIDLTFENDATIIGKWKAVAYCLSKKSFNPAVLADTPLYFSAIEFMPSGEVVSYYDYGKDKISGRHHHEWTKGYWLRKWNSSACAYEIQQINDTEYLFIEWKSGNYRWGGLETDYYVFVRNDEL